jgi:hypothetical protein
VWSPCVRGMSVDAIDYGIGASLSSASPPDEPLETEHRRTA